jgi:uncharacterized protein (TIGR00645 family)
LHAAPNRAKPNGMERLIENALLAARWILLPLYLALLLSVLAIFIMVARELYHLAEIILTGGEAEVVLILLSVLDMVLVANLLVMVAMSSYESNISRIDVFTEGNKPEWLGKLDSSQIKLKVSMAIVMISAIHLLRAFMNDLPAEKILTMSGVHLVFVVSTVLIAWVESKRH